MSKRKCRTPDCARVSCRPDGWCVPCARKRGKMQPNQNADIARHHLHTLKVKGWTNDAISEATGINLGTLTNLETGHTQHCLNTTVTALRILTTQPVTGVVYLPAWPTQRRVQSLLAAGHVGRSIAAFVGCAPTMISKLANECGVKVHRDIAVGVQAYWDTHANDPVTTPGFKYRDKPWVTPAWWDNIDDPAEQPGVSHCRRCHRDNIKYSGLCNACVQVRVKARRRERNAA